MASPYQRMSRRLLPAECVALCRYATRPPRRRGAMTPADDAAAWLMVTVRGMSLAEIGAFMRRTHITILHGVRRCDEGIGS